MRVSWIDNAKALGILAIVAGHAPGINEFTRQFFYTFHVPLFFFLSGFLLKPKHFQVSFPDYVRRNVGRLVVPYLFFWFFSTLLWLAFQAVAGKRFWETPSMLSDALSAMLMGTSESLLAVNGVLWFYTSLFTAALAFYWVAKNKSMSWVVAVLTVSGVLASIMPSLGVRLPWNIDLMFMAMVFYGAGFVVRDIELVDRITSFWMAFVAVVAGLSLTVAVVLVNKKVDMSWQIFGDSFLLFIIGAFAGILMIIGAGKILPETRVARYLSDNAIVIYSIHFPMFFAFWGVGTYVFKMPSNYEETSGFYPLIYVVGALMICLPVIWFIRKFMPWGLGARVAK